MLLKNTIKLALTLGAAFAALFATPVKATAPILNTNIGIYSPTILGQDLTFNACNTTLNGYSICDLASLAAFRIRWDINGQLYARFRDNNNANYDGPAADGLQVVVPTGFGTAFPAIGTYTIRLSIRIRHSNSNGVSSILLPDGSSVIVSTNQHVTSNDTTQLAVVATPEPGAILLLMLALGFIAVRINQDRIKKTVRQ